MRTRLTVSLVLLVALGSAPALTACAGIEGIVENATGGDIDLGGASLPADYPSADVPLYDGEITFGASASVDQGKIWNVTARVPGIDAIEQITAQLEGVGFTLANGGVVGPTADSATALLDSDAYGVLVVVSKDADNGFVANYTVTSKG